MKPFDGKHRNKKVIMIQNRLHAKGIFLDLDGTIVDSSEAYVEAAKTAFRTVGLKPPEMKALLEIPRRLEQGLTFDDLMNGNKQKFLNAYIKTYYSLTFAKTKLIPKVASTLEVLSGKAKLALITMRFVPKEVIIRELTQFDIAKYFTYVVTSLDTPKPKPSPDGLLACLRALDVQANECIIAGDSISDIRAGKAAGAKTVAVLSGLFQHEELVKEDPDLILQNLNMLPEFVE